MTYTQGALVGLLLAIQVSFTTPLLRFEGLERVYFEHVGMPGAPLASPPAVTSLLPKTVQSSLLGRQAIESPMLSDEVTVRDFRLSSGRWKRDLWLRQVVDRRHPRITDLWWALYDDGRRSDVWYFRADPARNENKLLTNYEIEDVSTTDNNAIVFRIRGEMFRPAGAWWVVGKVFTLSMTDNGLVLSRVRNVFGFFRDYDRGDTPGSIGVLTERELDERFEVRAFTEVPEDLLRRCKFRDPLIEDTWSWAEFEKVARCITENPDAKVTFRALDAPSFVERGGGGRE